MGKIQKLTFALILQIFFAKICEIVLKFPQQDVIHYSIHYFIRLLKEDASSMGARSPARGGPCGDPDGRVEGDAEDLQGQRAGRVRLPLLACKGGFCRNMNIVYKEYTRQI